MSTAKRESWIPDVAFSSDGYKSLSMNSPSSSSSSVPKYQLTPVLLPPPEFDYKQLQVGSNIIFSDEKKFNLDGPDGFNSYWHDLKKDPLHFSKRNFGGGRLMVWGAFSSAGTVDLAFVSFRMNSTDYQDVMTAKLIPYLRRFIGVSSHINRTMLRFMRADRLWTGSSPKKSR
ncbi:Protein CBG27374 [Caenorhabditis briggsae]|uniref:Protein CBG27374 n=1 Tax=Caenorhabditis briggsae TaxID=6238 RepID=B6IGH4_CAEBR|nr:Protein CBG27374 [Caenorhabditis briggsae]CAR99004.1 Protein CBG27374 [Caenorhabditis briggsae]